MTQFVASDDGYTDDDDDDDGDDVDGDGGLGGYGYGARKKGRNSGPGLMEAHESTMVARAMVEAMQDSTQDEQEEEDGGKIAPVRATRSSAVIRAAPSASAAAAAKERFLQMQKQQQDRAREAKVADLKRVAQTNSKQLVKAASNRLQEIEEKKSHDGRTGAGTVETGSTTTNGFAASANSGATTMPMEVAFNADKEEEEIIHGTEAEGEVRDEGKNDSSASNGAAMTNTATASSSTATPSQQQQQQQQQCPWFRDPSVPNVDESRPDVALPRSTDKKDISDITTDSAILRDVCDSTKNPPDADENMFSGPVDQEGEICQGHDDELHAFNDGATMTQDARDKEAADRSDEISPPDSLDNLIEEQRMELEKNPDDDDVGEEEEPSPDPELLIADDNEDDKQQTLDEQPKPAQEQDNMQIDIEQQNSDANDPEDENVRVADTAEVEVNAVPQRNSHADIEDDSVEHENAAENGEPLDPMKAPIQKTPEKQVCAPAIRSPNALSVGTIVQVEARTWPGVNKPGGVARITKAHTSESGTRYDVSYIVLGGKEKKVDATFVKLHEEQQEEFISPTKKKPVADNENINAGATRQDGRGTRRSARPSRASRGAPTQKENKLPSASKYMPETLSYVEAMKKAKADSLQVEEAKARSVEEGGGQERVSLVSTTAKTRRRGTTTGEANAKPAAVDDEANVSVLESIAEQDSPDRSITMSDDTKLQLADERYKELLQDKQTINAITSSLSDDDKCTLEQLRKELKKAGVTLKVLKDFKTHATDLCITSKSSTANVPENYILAKVRTLKVMRSALAGIPIVTPDWLRACLEEKELVIPAANNCIRSLPPKAGTEHLLPLDFVTHTGPTAWLGVAAYAALLQRQSEGGGEENDHLPLLDTSVFLCGQFNKGPGAPPKTDLLTLLRESGANVIPSAGAAAKKLKDDEGSTLVLLCDDAKSDKQSGITDALNKKITTALAEQTNRRILIVSFNWILDSISCGEILDALNYQPNSPRGKALWQLSTDE